MKLIYFDFFGVLAKPVYYTIIHTIVPESERAFWVRKLDDLDLGILSESDLVHQLATIANLPTEEIRTMANNAITLNHELLDYISTKLKPHYRIGLLTNIPKNMLMRMLGDKLTLFEPQIISSEVGYIKPSKEIFEIAIRAASCEASEILFIDDSAKNISQAISHGMSGIIYKDFPSFLKELKMFIPLSM